MMIGPVPLGAVINRFDDAVGHPQSQDRQGIPQAAHEYQVPRIPNPFKIKWKHYFSPLSGLTGNSKHEIRNSKQY